MSVRHKLSNSCQLLFPIQMINILNQDTITTEDTFTRSSLGEGFKHFIPDFVTERCCKTDQKQRYYDVNKSPNNRIIGCLFNRRQGLPQAKPHLISILTITLILTLIMLFISLLNYKILINKAQLSLIALELERNKCYKLIIVIN